MKSVLFAVIAGLALMPASAIAGDYEPITHSALQAVDSSGLPAWPTPPGWIELTGVVINNPWDALNYGSSQPSPEWQVFVQSTEQDDFGGTALYMRKKLPKDTGDIYDATAWGLEMDRLNCPLFDNVKVDQPLRYGDVIRVEARAPGLFYCGKYNVNEQHLADPAMDFDITILERGPTPEFENITLATLKSATDDFLFDNDKSDLDSCEDYQSRLVHLDGLILGSGTWTSGGSVTVRQIEQGDRTFSLRLGLDPALFTPDTISKVQNNPFGVTAILDQESPREGPFNVGYRLWLTNASGLTVVPEPGGLTLLATAVLTGLLMMRGRTRRAKN